LSYKLSFFKGGAQKKKKENEKMKPNPLCDSKLHANKKKSTNKKLHFAILQQ
jgi:hypothetical protein